ncbi:NHL repeat-containing protein [bacterium]|nr:NHL repeat-containing protein [bacterium]
MLRIHRACVLTLIALSLAFYSWAEPRIIEQKPTSLVYPPFWHTPFGIHRGTPELLKMFLGDRSILKEPQDLACTLLLSELENSRNTAEFQVTILGANAGQGHLIYNPDLTHLEVLGDRGESKRLFSYPLGTALHTDGSAYVTDPRHPAVFRLVLENKKLVPAGMLTPPPGGWKQPWGVALDSQGSLYVSDAKRDQLFVYSPKGDLLQTIGPQLSEQIRLSQPGSLTVVDPLEPWSFYHDGYIFVIDQSGKRLLRLDLAGRVQKVLEARKLTEQYPEFTFAWMELDYYENVWITDPVRSQIHKFNRQLAYLTSYGRVGNGDYRFEQPTGLAIHRHFGQVFVAEKNGAHYFWIGSDILRAQVQQDATHPHLLRIEFFLTEPAWLTVEIKSSPRLRQPFLSKKQWADSGQRVVFWNSEQTKGIQTEGFWITAEATYSSARYMAKRVFIPRPKLISSYSLSSREP